MALREGSPQKWLRRACVSGPHSSAAFPPSTTHVWHSQSTSLSTVPRWQWVPTVGQTGRFQAAPVGRASLQLGQELGVASGKVPCPAEQVLTVEKVLAYFTRITSPFPGQKFLALRPASSNVPKWPSTYSHPFMVLGASAWVSRS